METQKCAFCSCVSPELTSRLKVEIVTYLCPLEGTLVYWVSLLVRSASQKLPHGLVTSSLSLAKKIRSSVFKSSF